jgi:ABC-2 type transport system ATP-binding protein
MSIVVRGVSKGFDKKPVLKDISLDIGRGEIACLLGPSGAGKTTLIRLLLGAIRADAGEIEIDGIRVPSMKLFEKIGFMPQNDALYSDLSGLDNLAFFGGLYKLKDVRKRAIRALELLGLANDKDKLVANYSGGMKKRLSLAVALLNDPKYLLLDEPTVGIDPILRKSIWDEFYHLRDEGACIVISTHVMDEAAKCDRTALIYGGALIYNDTTANLLAKTEDGNIESLFFAAKGARA